MRASTEPLMTTTTAKRAIPKAPAHARAVLEIDLDALRRNWAKLNVAAGRAECAGVVKADAYGLGLEEITTALVAEGCETFFVATLAEGRRVRSIAPGATIYILDGLLPGAGAHYTGFDLRPVLSSIPEIEEWAAICRQANRRYPAAVHVDTGMHRLGVPGDEFERLVGEDGAIEAFELAVFMSHLACADQHDHPLNRDQRAAFETLRALVPHAPASLSNSGGTFLGPDFHYDLVRPGIALYGGRAFEGGANPMDTVVRLYARILQVQSADKGASVGYGASHHCTRRSRIATIACGYADGFLRALGGDDARPGPVGYVGDHEVRIVGRVSMDLISLDVTDVPEHLVHRGGWVEVMGDRVSVDDLTDRAGTIGYELLSRLSRRVHREYVERSP